MVVHLEDCCYNCGKTLDTYRRDDKPIGVLRYDTGDESVGMPDCHYLECIECFLKYLSVNTLHVKTCPKCHNVLAIIKKYGKEIGLCHVCDEEFDEHQYCFNCGGDYSRCDCTHEQFIKAKMKDIEGDCPSQYQTEESDGK